MSARPRGTNILGLVVCAEEFALYLEFDGAADRCGAVQGHGETGYSGGCGENVPGQNNALRCGLQNPFSSAFSSASVPK